jgi:hypothetical protein
MPRIKKVKDTSPVLDYFLVDGGNWVCNIKVRTADGDTEAENKTCGETFAKGMFDSTLGNENTMKSMNLGV